jgi:putative membrane protein
VIDIRVLVLAIDRDDDFGKKAGVKGPVIGRDACIDAALKLSLADPEDSDANVVYAAVKLADELKKRGEFEEVEVALITGHPKVGLKSDLELTRQLEEVLKVFPADGVIPVTDGAEDEQIFPIIASKVPIVTSHRVVVKQSPGIETTWYIIVKYTREILSDPEVAKVVFGIPGLMALLYGLAKLVGVWYPESEKIVSTIISGTILLLIGAIFFAKGFNVDFRGLMASLRRAVVEQFVVVLSIVAGLLIILSGLINAYLNLEKYSLQLIGSYPGTPLLATLIYLNALAGPLAIGIGVMISGKILQAYLKRDYHIWYSTSALLMTPALWVTIDLTTRYALSILTISDIDVFQKLVFAVFDIAFSVVIGVYLRGKVKGWMKVDGVKEEPSEGSGGVQVKA